MRGTMTDVLMAFGLTVWVGFMVVLAYHTIRTW